MGRHKKAGRKKVLTKKEASDNKKESYKKYRKNNLKCINLAFNKETDKDIIDWLEQQDSKQKAIRNVLKSFINKGNL